MRLRQLLPYLLWIAAVPFVSGQRPLVYEAEAAELGASVHVTTQQGVTYASPINTISAIDAPHDTANVLTFKVAFPQSGSYDLYARIRVGAGMFNDDSFFFGRDFGTLSVDSTAAWYMVNGLTGSGSTSLTEYVSGRGTSGALLWKWVNVSEFVRPTAPYTFTVSDIDSIYTFQLATREDGLDIDKIAFAPSSYLYTVLDLDTKQAGVDAATLSNGYLKTAYRAVETFLNPVLPGDHPDPTLVRRGTDFYVSGSSYHFTPYGVVLHSTDLVHWETVSRVVPSSWAGLVSDAPSAGVWQGALTYFYGIWWYYFSNDSGYGQYVSKALSPNGPWSSPVKVNNALGYDNSVFVDDNGTPYLLMKLGKSLNRIQQIGYDGQLTGTCINLDWMNPAPKYPYAWAEGPVMCKRKGWYYYFVSGNVFGGQWAFRSRTLTSDSTAWEPLGSCWEWISDDSCYFRSPNHMSAPCKLDDGSWWCVAHCYEARGTDDWSGRGRQGILCQVLWDVNDKPIVRAATTSPVAAPLPMNRSIPWALPRSDLFETSSLQPAWYFLNKRASTLYSLVDRPGWLVLKAGADSTHLLQKEAGRYYSVVTCVDVRPKVYGQSAGIYVTNGNQSHRVRVYSTFASGRKLVFQFDALTYSVENSLGDTVWLRLDRAQHVLNAYYSSDGLSWHKMGPSIDVSSLDKAQDAFNSWVGNSVGLFAERVTAAFDAFGFRDAHLEYPLVTSDNQLGMERASLTGGAALTNSTAEGGWVMLGGIDFGPPGRTPSWMDVVVSSSQSARLELWVDGFEGVGTQLVALDVPSSGGLTHGMDVTAPINGVSGQHDVYLRVQAPTKTLNLYSLQFKDSLDIETGTVAPTVGVQYRVFPNPTKSVFWVQPAQSIRASYWVCDLMGKVLESGTVDPNRPLGAHLQQGSYLLRVADEGGIQTYKIRKK
jgi:beta-xylosidase